MYLSKCFSFFLLIVLFNLSFANKTKPSCKAAKCPKSTIAGYFPPVYPGFDKNGNLDLSTVPKYAKYLLNSGIDGVLVGAVSTAAELLTVAEKKLFINAWMKQAKANKLKVIVQVGAEVYKDVLDLAKFAKDAGAYAIEHLPEIFFVANTTDRLVQYTAGIAKEIFPTPIVYYNTEIIGDTANMVKYFAEATLKIPNFAGLKTDLNTALQVLAANTLTPDQFIISSESVDIVGAAIFCLNATSTLEANIFPALTIQIKEAIAVCDLATAVNLQIKINKAIVNAVGVINADTKDLSKFAYELPVLRYVFNLVSGINIGDTRFPLVALTDDLKKEVQSVLMDLGVKLSLNVLDILP